MFEVPIFENSDVLECIPDYLVLIIPIFRDNFQHFKTDKISLRYIIQKL